MTKKILIWDNYGTIMGARHPHAHEPLKLVRFILPNVENTMTQDKKSPQGIPTKGPGLFGLLKNSVPL